MTYNPWQMLAEIPILDMTGREFLAFYACAFAAAIIWTVFRKRAAVRNFSIRGAENTHVTDPYELAYLAGGAPRCTQVGLLRLVEMGCVEWRSSTLLQSKLVATGAAPQSGESIEESLYADIANHGAKGMPVKQAAKSVVPRLYGIESRLAKQGLRPTGSERSTMGMKASLPLFGLFLLGLAKVFIGIDRDKPVILLVLFLFVTFFTAFVMGRSLKRLTPAGEGLLDRLRASHPPVPLTGGTGDDGNFMMITSLALLGPSVLSAYGHPLGADKAFQQDLNNMGSVPSSGGCSSGCGGGDGGSSGCGGGGCGGCGGGD